MATLEINGKRVQVDDGFLSMSPEQQQAAVEEIAAQIGIGTSPAEPERPGWAWEGSAGGLAYDMLHAGEGAEGYEPSAVPWLDPINAAASGFVDQIPVIGPTLTDWGNQVDAAFNNMLGFEPQTAEDRAQVNAGNAERFPVMDVAGRIGGTVAPLAGLASTQLGGQLLGTAGNVGQQMLMGMISGGVLGGADTKARGGSWNDAGTNALIGAGGGALVPGVGAALGPVVRALLGQSGSEGARMLTPALRADGITSADDIARLLSQSDELRIADLGPNVQGQAGALATRPSDAQRVIIDALGERQQGGNARIRAATDDILGPATTPAQFSQGITEARQALSPAYETAFANARAVDTSDLALTLDSIAVNARGEAQQAAQTVRNMLNVRGVDDQLDPNPQTLFEVRKAIDGMIGSTQDNNVRRVLTQARREVDDILTAAVPGIKEADAQYAGLMRQQEAFDLGQTILDSGRGAIRPPELAGFTANAGDDVLNSLSQGARAEIDRIIGTGANDRIALQRIMKGEGSWNYDRLVSTFGQQRADDLLAVLSRERLMAETEALAMAGSRTAPLTAAQQALFDERQPGIVRQSMNMKFGDAVASAADTVAGGYFQQQRQRALAELAELLMSGQGNTQAQADIARALSQHQQGMFPPASVPMLLLPEPERQPLRIVVDGANPIQ